MINVEKYNGEDVPTGCILARSTGGSIIKIDGEIKNPPDHLRRARVSKKIKPGIYEILKKVENDITERRHAYTIKRPDLLRIVPSFDPKNYMGAVHATLDAQKMYELLGLLRSNKGHEDDSIIIVGFVKQDKGITVKFARIESTLGDKPIDLV